MKNLHYMNNAIYSDIYIELKPNYYGILLAGDNYIIKDINYSIVNYDELKTIYNRKVENWKNNESNQIESI